MTLMSEKILDSSSYDDGWDGVNIKWSNCNLRDFCNNVFYHYAFIQEEKYDIQTSYVENLDSPGGLSGGENTYDYVYVPSIEDLMNPSYGFSSGMEKSSGREAKYVKGVGVTTPTSGDVNSEKGTCHYWTRSVASLAWGFLFPYRVTSEGQISSGGRTYCTWRLGVRPMIQLSKSSTLWREYIPTTNLSTSKQTSGTIQINVQEYGTTNGSIKDASVDLENSGNGTTDADGNVTLNNTVTSTSERQMLTVKSLGPVPLYLEFGAGLKLSAEVVVGGYNFNTGKFYGDLESTIEPYLYAELGTGVLYVATASVEGKASMPTKLNITDGLESMEMVGKLTLKLKALLWEFKYSFPEVEDPIYPAKSTTKAAASGSLY